MPRQLRPERHDKRVFIRNGKLAEVGERWSLSHLYLDSHSRSPIKEINIWASSWRKIPSVEPTGGPQVSNYRPFGVSHYDDHETKHRSRTNYEQPAYAMEGRRREIPRLPPVLWLSLNANEAGEGRCQGCPTWPLRHLRTGRSGGSVRLVRDNRTADRGSATETRSGVGCPLRRRLRETMARRKRQERCVRMARQRTEWPSKRGPRRKIRPSDGCKGDAVPLAVGKWNDFH